MDLARLRLDTAQELVLHERLQKDLVSLRTRTPWTPQQPSETFGRGAFVV